tara:strand:+ start:766 stop:1014 length:249 start_codon:yes stop_codon:yes gene_type:complete
MFVNNLMRPQIVWCLSGGKSNSTPAVVAPEAVKPASGGVAFSSSKAKAGKPDEDEMRISRLSQGTKGYKVNKPKANSLAINT